MKMTSINELGLLLIFAGIILVIIGSIVSIFESQPRRKREEYNEVKEETKVGGVIFIGPIPIIFGSDKKMALWALVLGVIIFAVYLIFLYFY